MEAAEDADVESGAINAELTTVNTYWTPYFSEEQPPMTCRSGYVVDGVQCQEDNCDSVRLRCAQSDIVIGPSRWTASISEEPPALMNCADNEVVTGLACYGSDCDNVSLQCSRIRTSRGPCTWSGWYSEEQPAFTAGTNRVIAGIRCRGDYCDDMAYLECTVFGADLSVSLVANPNQVLWPYESRMLTVTANQNVGPTPYFLSIYDQQTGARLALCSSGTTCSATVADTGVRHYQAFIAGSALAYPPPDTHVASSSLEVIWREAQLDPVLTASATTLATGASVTLTAGVERDVAPSGLQIAIFDVTTGALLQACSGGITCNVTVSQSSATTHGFAAYLTKPTTTIPKTGQHTLTSYVTWAPAPLKFSIALRETSTGAIAETNGDVGPTPYYIEIFNAKTGVRLNSCSSGKSCAISLNMSAQWFLVAFVSGYSGALPPASIQASSPLLEIRPEGPN